MEHEEEKSTVSNETSLMDFQGQALDQALVYANQVRPVFEGQSFIPVLGNTGAGRTTLLRYLSGQSFDRGLSDIGFPIAVTRTGSEPLHYFTEVKENELVRFSAGHFWKAPSVGTDLSSPNTVLEISVAMRFARQVNGWLCVIDYPSFSRSSSQEGKNELLSKFASLIQHFPGMLPDSVLFVITQLPHVFEASALYKAVCRDLNRALAKINPQGQPTFKVSERNVLLCDVFDQGASRDLILLSIASLTPISSQVVANGDFFSAIHFNIRRILQAQEEFSRVQAVEVEPAGLQAQPPRVISQDVLHTAVKEGEKGSSLQKEIAKLKARHAKIVEEIASKEQEIREKDSEDPVIAEQLSIPPTESSRSTYIVSVLSGFGSGGITAIPSALVASNPWAWLLPLIVAAAVGIVVGVAHRCTRRSKKHLTYESLIPILRVEKRESTEGPSHFFNEHLVPNKIGGTGSYSVRFEGYLGPEDRAEVVIYVKSRDYHRASIALLHSKKTALEQERINVYWDLERRKMELPEPEVGVSDDECVEREALPHKTPVSLKTNQLKALLKTSEQYFPVLRAIISLFFQESLTPDMRAFLNLIDGSSPSNSKREQQSERRLSNPWQQFLETAPTPSLQPNSLGEERRGEAPESYQAVLSSSSRAPLDRSTEGQIVQRSSAMQLKQTV